MKFIQHFIHKEIELSSFHRRYKTPITSPANEKCRQVKANRKTNSENCIIKIFAVFIRNN